MVEQEGQAASSGLDPEIEALLDSPDQDKSVGDDTIQSPINQESDGEEDPERFADRDDAGDMEEATSWVELLDTIGEDSPMHIHLWGRFWGQLENVAAAFYLRINPDQKEISTQRIIAYGNPSPLSKFYPRMDARDFEQRLLEAGVRNEAVPKVIYQQIEQAINEYFESKQTCEKIQKIVEEDDLDQFRNWSSQFVRNIIERGEFEFQFRGQQISKSKLDESETQRKSTVQAHSEQKNTSDRSHPDLLEVSLLTSPNQGIAVTDLTDGDRVFIRIIDDRARHLPDHYLDTDRSPPATFPLEATVEEINTPDSLPDRLEGSEPEDYREIIVDLEQAIPGRALLYIEDRIKQEQPEPPPDDFKLETLPFLLVLAVLLLVVLMIVF